MKIKHLGKANILVILITLVLFIAALFSKGLTHDLLLETAVFLVSVKLIILSYRNSMGVQEIQEKLDKILTEEKHLEAVLMAMKNRPKAKAGSSTADTDSTAK